MKTITVIVMHVTEEKEFTVMTKVGNKPTVLVNSFQYHDHADSVGKCRTAKACAFNEVMALQNDFIVKVEYCVDHI